MGHLLDNQIKAKLKLQKSKVGALFMEAGTGKTRACCELIDTIENVDLIVWFTPFQTKQNLSDEIWKWQEPKMPKWVDIDLEIVGIESIQNSDKLYLDLHQKINEADNPVIIVDESLKIKNLEAKRTQRIITLSKLCEYKLILNGTPISKNLLDIYTQFEFLSTKILSMSYAEFKNTFCEYKGISIRKGNQTRSKEWIVKYHNLDYLYKLIEPYVFECDLDIQIGKQYINIDFDLSEEEKTGHEKILNRILDNEWLMAKPNFFLELTQKLQNNYSRSAEKFLAVQRILNEVDEHKVLIFAKYIETQKTLKLNFPNVKILSYQKHSLGLNLQAYSCIIFFDKIWDYALIEQAEHRIFRTGQEEDCIFYNLTGNVGLETMIDNNVKNKASLLKEFKKLSLEQFKERVK